MVSSQLVRNQSHLPTRTKSKSPQVQSPHITNLPHPTRPIGIPTRPTYIVKISRYFMSIDRILHNYNGSFNALLGTLSAMITNAPAACSHGPKADYCDMELTAALLIKHHEVITRLLKMFSMPFFSTSQSLHLTRRSARYDCCKIQSWNQC